MAHPNVKSSPVYARYESPGVALIIVNENFEEKEKPRSAADKDFQTLMDTFGELGFKIVALYNVTAAEIHAVIKRGNGKLKGFKDQDSRVCFW